MDIPFTPSDFSLETQRFLFSCALEVLFADEKVVIDEKEWLVEQFGAERALSFFEELHAEEGDPGPELFQKMLEDIPHEDLKILRPSLRDWLMCAAFSDGKVVGEESEHINAIMARTDWEYVLPGSKREMELKIREAERQERIQADIERHKKKGPDVYIGDPSVNFD